MLSTSPSCFGTERRCELETNPRAWQRWLRLALEQGNFRLLLIAPVSQGQQSVDILLHFGRSGATIQFVPREEGVGDRDNFTRRVTSAAAPLASVLFYSASSSLSRLSRMKGMSSSRCLQSVARTLKQALPCSCSCLKAVDEKQLIGTRHK